MDFIKNMDFSKYQKRKRKEPTHKGTSIPSYVKKRPLELIILKVSEVPEYKAREIATESGGYYNGIQHRDRIAYHDVYVPK